MTTRVNQVEAGLRQIEAGRFQKLANEYLCREHGLKHLSAFGSQAGTDKTTIGVPDAYSYEDGGYVLIAHTTNTSDTFNKLKADVEDCLTKSSVPDNEIRKILCCHTNFRLSPEDELAIRRIDERVDIINPSQVARDIIYKYPVLAHEYFGIPLGSGAFKTRNEYLAAQDRTRYATSQSCEIMFRDEEILDLKNRLKNGAKAVIVTGSSGCGKTKLALEACASYCEECNKYLLVLEARNASHAEADIDTVISDAENAVILVDDANQQTALDHLLDVVASKESVSLVATVRSYALRDLTKRIGLHVKPCVQEISVLDDEQIHSIITGQFDVSNPTNAERIASIAHGNLRLAIMAATALGNGDAEALVRPYDMLSAYIEPRLEQYSPEMIKALEAFAIWGVCDLQPDDEACKYLDSVGIGITEASGYARKLNDDEVVDLLTNETGVLAVRFQEQNLRDYLVFKAVVKDNSFDLSTFIVEHILDRREQVIGVCRIVLGVFGDENAVDVVRAAARIALAQAEDGSPLMRELMSGFHILYGGEALEYVNRLIIEGPEREIWEELFLANNSADTSVTLHILAGALRQSEYAEIAAEIVAECVVRGCEEDGEYRWFFSRDNALSVESLDKGFKEEKLLLEALGDAYVRTKSGNVASCLLLFVETLLHGSGDSVVRGESGSMRISLFRLPCCSQRARLDYECLKSLHPILGDERFSSRVWTQFSDHFCWHDDLNPDPDFVKMLSEEVVLLRDMLTDYFIRNGVEEYGCFLRLNELLKCSGAEPMQASPVFGQGVIDAWMLHQNESRVGGIIHDWRLERLISVCEAVASIPQSSRLWWDFRELVPKVIGCLANGDYSCEQCLSLLIRYLKKIQDIEFLGYLRAGLLEPLVASYGYRSIRNGLKRADLGDVKAVALDALDSIGISVCPEKVDQEELLTMLVDGELHLDYWTVSRLCASEGSFLYAYTTKTLRNIVERPHLITSFFRPVAKNSRESFVQSIAATFDGRMEELVRWYAVFLHEDSFDYNGLIALLLFERCDSFASDYVSSCTFEGFIRRGSATDRIERMWSAENAAMPTIMDRLVEQFYSGENLFGNPVAAFLPVRSLKVGSLRTCWDWLFGYIDGAVGDVRRMQDVVQAFGDVGDSERLEVLTHVLTRDVAGNLVGNLWIGRTSMSGDYRQGCFQAYKREADLLRKLSESLPKTKTYLSHKAWLEKYALHTEAMAQDELWRAFHRI